MNNKAAREMNEEAQNGRQSGKGPGELRLDANKIIPHFQQESARIISGMVADLAVKDAVIERLQERIAELESQDKAQIV